MGFITQILVELLTAMFSNGRAPIDTQQTPPQLLSAAYCGQCHEAEYAEWQQSRHRNAWSNGIFQHDYQRTPRAWCRNCHIPLAAQQQAYLTQDSSQVALVDEGVNCAACHVRKDAILARSKHPNSPHNTKIMEGFGNAQFCAGCHQFNFPVFDESGTLSRYSAHPMQATVAQYRASDRKSDRACLGCHANTGAGHLFPGAHDVNMLRRALKVRMCNSQSHAIRVIIENVGAGHNVPTGDVHRHIVAKLWRPTEPERLVENFIGRRFALAEGGGKTTTWDSTIAPGKQRIWDVQPASLSAQPIPPNPTIHFELRYIYGSSEYPKIAYEPPEPAFVAIERRQFTSKELPPCTSPQ